MKKLIALLFLSTVSAFAQPSNPSIVLVSIAPSGSCSVNLPDQQVITTGALYSCQSGTWVKFGTSSSSGTVTSVTFTGNGIVDSSTPSTAVTASGTVTATALTQTANFVLAGPTTGAATAPTFRALVNADFPGTLAPTISGVNLSALPTGYSPIGQGLSYYAWCTGTVGTGNATVYALGPGQAGLTCSGTSSGAYIPFPATCTAKNLYANALAAGAVTGSGVVTFRLAGAGSNPSNTALTCTLGTGKSCSDTSHTVSVTAGNVWQITVLTGQGTDTTGGVAASFECQ